MWWASRKRQSSPAEFLQVGPSGGAGKAAGGTSSVPANVLQSVEPEKAASRQTSPAAPSEAPASCWGATLSPADSSSRPGSQRPSSESPSGDSGGLLVISPTASQRSESKERQQGPGQQAPEAPPAPRHKSILANRESKEAWGQSARGTESNETKADAKDRRLYKRGTSRVQFNEEVSRVSAVSAVSAAEDDEQTTSPKAQRKKLESKIQEVEAKKKEAIEAEQFDVAHALKQEELRLKAQLQDLMRNTGADEESKGPRFSMLDAHRNRVQNVNKELMSVYREHGSIARLRGSFIAPLYSRSIKSFKSKDFIRSPAANSICGLVILTNALLIGVELEKNHETDTDQLAWFLIESFFLVFFMVELYLRVRSFGFKDSIRDIGVLFDMLLIILGIFDTWVLQILLVTNFGGAFFKLTLLRVLRLFRMIRVLRVIKLFRYFHEIVVLARGIVGAMRALGWSVVLIFMCLYMSAIMTTSWYKVVVQGDKYKAMDREEQESFGELFSTVGNSILTLFQIMSLEGWPRVVWSCMELWHHSWIFFIPFIIVTNVFLLNIVTAVVVEKVWEIVMSEAADEAKRAEKNRLASLKRFRRLFESMDLDYSSELDINEWREALKKPTILQELLEFGLARFECDELFECLDVDGNGQVSVAEFVDGCLRVQGLTQSKHLLQVQYDLLRTFKSVKGVILELHEDIKVALRHLSKFRARMEKARAPTRRRSLTAIAAKAAQFAISGQRRFSDAAITALGAGGRRASDAAQPFSSRSGNRRPSLPSRPGARRPSLPARVATDAASEPHSDSSPDAPAKGGARKRCESPPQGRLATTASAAVAIAAKSANAIPRRHSVHVSLHSPSEDTGTEAAPAADTDAEQPGSTGEAESDAAVGSGALPRNLSPTPGLLALTAASAVTIAAKVNAPRRHSVQVSIAANAQKRKSLPSSLGLSTGAEALATAYPEMMQAFLADSAEDTRYSSSQPAEDAEEVAAGSQNPEPPEPPGVLAADVAGARGVEEAAPAAISKDAPAGGGAEAPAAAWTEAGQAPTINSSTAGAWRPAKKLLATAWKEQMAMSRTIETLLMEARDVHGHISETAALMYQTHEDDRSVQPRGLRRRMVI